MQYAGKIEETLVRIDSKADATSSSSKSVVTPLCTPRPALERSKSRTSIKSTPVNRKRSNNRRRSSFNRTMNVTNLNILFDSSYINQNTPPQEEKRTWQSPRTNGSTQTINLDYQQQSSPAIVETPKISQFSALEELVSQIKSPPKGPTGSTKNKIHYLDAHVNLNPYVNNADVKLVHKDPSLGEISFFTPHLYNLKSASTPIDKIASNYLKNSPIKESPKNVKVNNADDAVKVDDKISNLIFQSTPLAEATDKQKGHKNAVSPKTKRSKNFTIIHNVSRISKSNTGYRTFSSDVQEKQSGVEIIFNRLKKLSRTSVRWSYKILDFCNYIGVALKRSLSSLCSAYRVESTIETVETESILCKCSDYKRRIRTCSSDIDQLKTELYQVRSQIEIRNDYEQKIKEISEDYEQKIRTLCEELHHVKEEFEEFRGFKDEFEDFKQRFRNNSHTPSPAVAPPPLPPPPPPPPPPPQPTKIAVRLCTKKSNRSNKENSRPIISLDDILKVKLKKTAERPSPYRRNTQPAISSEMLKQVKLKPPSRAHTPIDLEALSTSPRSSLTRLLNSDNSTKPVGKTGEGEDLQLNGVV